MKKIAITLFILLMTFSYAYEKPFSFYGNIHAVADYPMLGVGFRKHRDIHAIDLSANFCPIDPPKSLSIFHIRGLYLLYPMQKGPYFGGGFGFLNEEETLDDISATLEGVIGYEWKSRIFIQASVTTLIQDTFTLEPWPSLSIGYGF